MVAYVIFDVTVNDLQGYEDYKKLAPLAISKYAGKYLARGGKSEILEGNWGYKSERGRQGSGNESSKSF